jgi:hypothetical protein
MHSLVLEELSSWSKRILSGSLALWLAVTFVAPAANAQISERDVLAANQLIYESLFDSPWDLSTAEYNIDGTRPFTGSPGFYAGTNDIGTPFQFEVTDSEVVDYAALDVPIEVVLALQTSNTIITNLGITVSTELASFEVTAKALSYTDSKGALQNSFTIGYYAEEMSYLVVGGQDLPPVEIGDLEWCLAIICFTVSYPCVLDSEECNNCYSDYLAALDSIQFQYDTLRTIEENNLAAAQAAFHSCIQSAEYTFLAQAAVIEALYVIAIAGCLAGTGPVSPLCMVLATAANTALVIGNAVDLEIAQQSCQDNLDIAEANFEANMEALNDWADGAREAAEDTLENCREQNGCITTCTVTLCYWILYPC